MKYGYFKSRGANLWKGTLEYKYNQLKKIPNIKIYYDYCRKGSPFLHALLNKLENGDSLYVYNIHDLGEKTATIFDNLKLFQENNIRFFIGDKGICIDKVFKKINEWETFNKENLKSRLWGSNIQDFIIRELEKISYSQK